MCSPKDIATHFDFDLPQVRVADTGHQQALRNLLKILQCSRARLAIPLLHALCKSIDVQVFVSRSVKLRVNSRTVCSGFILVGILFLLNESCECLALAANYIAVEITDPLQPPRRHHHLRRHRRP